MTLIFHLSFLLSCSSGRLWSYDASEDKELQVNHADEILCLALTADSRYMITGSKDCSLKMWQLGNGKLVQVNHNMPLNGGNGTLHSDLACFRLWWATPITSLPSIRLQYPAFSYRLLATAGS